MDAISQYFTLDDLQRLLPGLRARVRIEPRAVVGAGKRALCISGEPFVTSMLLGRPGQRRPLFVASLQRFLHSPRARGWRRGLLPITGTYVRQGPGERGRRVHERPEGAEIILAAAAFRALELPGRGCYDVCFLLTRDGAPVRIDEAWRWLGGERSRTSPPGRGVSVSSHPHLDPRWSLRGDQVGP